MNSLPPRSRLVPFWARRGFGCLLLFGALVLASCGGSTAASEPPASIRLGYFANLTHATALVGIEEGIFQTNLGQRFRLEAKAFNAGPAVVESLFSGALDVAYMGPSPSINAFVRSKGEAIRIIAGSASGGAFLVVREEITRAGQLKGKTLASPSLGNTQDVALRTWLRSQGLTTDTQGGGDVSVVPQENAETLQSFSSGDVDGAWVPEPWATRLVLQAEGNMLVDERDLWPQGKYVTTHLVVRSAFLKEHPELVEALLRGHIEANAFLNARPEESREIVNGAIFSLAGKRLSGPVITKAWGNLTFTNDPIASSLRRSARDAFALGLVESADITGIYDLTTLNRLLESRREPPVSS